jgi:alpha-glucosidase
MLCDNPSNYYAEEECTSILSKIPTTWDESKALNGELSKYITLARRKGNTWHIGSMTNWDKRTLELDLSFLGNGEFKAEIIRDGLNAHRVASDYIKENIDIPTDKKIRIDMSEGGGYYMKIERK